MTWAQYVEFAETTAGGEKSSSDALKEWTRMSKAPGIYKTDKAGVVKGVAGHQRIWVFASSSLEIMIGQLFSCLNSSCAFPSSV